MRDQERQECGPSQLAEANRIINGTFVSARRRKAYPLAAIVLDAGGRVKAFQKQDGASLMRFEIAYGKAFGALALNRSSRQVLQKAKEKPPFMDSLTELSDGPLFLEAGGQLIRDASGEIVGAIGVTATSTRSTTSALSTASRPAGSGRCRLRCRGGQAPNIKVDPPLRDPAPALGGPGVEPRRALSCPTSALSSPYPDP